ncbi:MAG TPA: signal peptidase II [Clostridiales bacterium]|nr:signal peptidase II [Clostridiales bacterium]
MKNISDKKINKKYKIVIFVTILVLLEQLTKIVILKNRENLPITVINNVFMLSYVENSGVAFGIKVGSVWSFIIVNIVILGIIIKFMYSQLQELNNKTIIILSLVLAGGISNLVDRIFRGYVVDFLDITPIINFPVFNFADIMIVVAVFIFGVMMIKNIIKDGKKGNSDGKSNSTSK